jgi:hypothetical protein
VLDWTSPAQPSMLCTHYFPAGAKSNNNNNIKKRKKREEERNEQVESEFFCLLWGLINTAVFYFSHTSTRCRRRLVVV